MIFFDGVCGLCNAWIDFVVARDKTRVFRFGPLQGDTAREWLHLAPDAGADGPRPNDRRATAARWLPGRALA